MSFPLSNEIEAALRPVFNLPTYGKDELPLALWLDAEALRVCR